MRFFDWLSPQWTETITRWLAFFSFSALSPMRWLVEYALSPYVNLSNPSQWATLIEQVQQLPPDTLQFKLLPTLMVCLSLNIAYVLLCRKISTQIAQTVKQRLQPSDTV